MKKLLLILLLALPLSVQGKLYAVLIGISEYEQSAINLRYCHRDANEMYELLKEHTEPERIKLLTNGDASHDNIVYNTEQLFQQTQPEDVVIFFFAGHGNKNGFFTYDKMLYFGELQDIFKQTSAKRKIIFADACFSGTLRQSGNRSASNKADMGKNVLLFLSSRSDQKSQEFSILKDGVFTYFLLAALRGEADSNNDGYITAKELFYFVNPKVKEESNGEQIPVMWGKFDENMVILKLNDK